jgi:hypothetical protein
VLALAFVIYGKSARENYAASRARHWAVGEVRAARKVHWTVLPFLYLTDETSREIFADGVTENVIDHAARFRVFVCRLRERRFQLKPRRDWFLRTTDMLCESYERPWGDTALRPSIEGDRIFSPCEIAGRFWGSIRRAMKKF